MQCAIGTLALLFVLSLCGCERAPQGDGIYYWQTTWRLDSAAQSELVAAHLNRVFVRLFDLGWDAGRGQAYPIAPLQLPPPAPATSPPSRHLLPSLTFTPVVFIVNDLWAHEPNPEALAIRLLKSIDRYAQEYPALTATRHLQVDCDWTARTRVPYFRMLAAMRRARPEWTFSATIRLHQYRDRATAGIPPVDRGLLMCYNLAPATDPATKDAIFDLQLLKGYLQAAPYPLALDGALPLFTWGAAFRGRTFLGLTDHPGQFPATYIDGRGVILRDTVIGSHFLRPGDYVRADGLDGPAEMATARQLLRSRAGVDNILYYDWQEHHRGFLGEITQPD